MKKIQAEFELKTGKTKKDLSDIADGVNDVKTGLNNVTTQGKKTNKVLKGISNLFKGALGLGIVIKAFDILKETFMANQKVADTFATVMETISLVFNQVVNAVVKGNGEFNALGKVLTNVLNIGLAPFKLAFEGISIAIMSAQKAFLQFTGGSKERIAELTLGIIEAKYAALEIGEGVIDSGKAIVENFGAAVDSIKEISITAAYETAKANVELEKSAEVAAVINQGLIEKYDRQAEQQRQIRDDESKTIEERIAANNKLGEVLEEQQKLMLENVDLQIKSAQAQYDKNASQENYIALLEAQNEREAVLAQIEGFRSEQKTNLNSLNREALELQKEAIETEDERIEKIAELTNFEILTAVEKLQRDRDNALAELDLLEATEAEKQKIKDHYAEEYLKQAEEDAKKRKELINDTLDAVIDAAGAETKVGKALFLAKQAIRIQEQIEQAKATLQELGLIATKSVADTASGAASTAKVGFPQNIPLLIAFAGQAAGIISSIKSAVGAAKGQASAMGASGGSGGSISTPSIPTIAAQAPDFNVVGSSGTNQLAQAINGQDKQNL